jgi:choline-sulfatase
VGLASLVLSVACGGGTPEPEPEFTRKPARPGKSRTKPEAPPPPEPIGEVVLGDVAADLLAWGDPDRGVLRLGLSQNRHLLGGDWVMRQPKRRNRPILLQPGKTGTVRAWAPAMDAPLTMSCFSDQPGTVAQVGVDELVSVTLGKEASAQTVAVPLSEPGAVSVRVVAPADARVACDALGFAPGPTALYLDGEPRQTLLHRPEGAAVRVRTAGPVRLVAAVGDERTTVLDGIGDGAPLALPGKPGDPVALTLAADGPTIVDEFVLLGDGEATPRTPTPTNVLLLVVDTLRADHVGEQTTHMARLAAEGARFDAAWSHAPFTGPAHASLFTSLLPQDHGVHNNGYRLDLAHRTLAEYLQGAGRDTVAYVSLGVLSSRFGFSQGFRRYDDEMPGVWWRPTDEIVEAATAWLADRDDDEPFFLFVHTNDPHEPYAPTDAAITTVRATVDGEAVGEWPATGERRELTLQLDAGTTEIVLDKVAGFAVEGESELRVRGMKTTLGEARFGTGWSQVARGKATQGSPLPATLVLETETAGEATFAFQLDEMPGNAELRRRYASEVQTSDAAIGEILAALEASGQADDTLVILTSDHGEGLGDHGHIGHVDQLYDSLLRVPLVVRGPGVPAGTVVTDPVQHLDVLPTVLELLGIDTLRPLRGRSLVPLFGGGSLPATDIISATYAPEAPRDLEGVVRDGHKYIRTTRPPGEELYDLAADPREARDLSADDPARVTAARGVLRKVAPASFSLASDVSKVHDDEVREGLEALGYVEEVDEAPTRERRRRNK